MPHVHTHASHLRMSGEHYTFRFSHKVDKKTHLHARSGLAFLHFAFDNDLQSHDSKREKNYIILQLLLVLYFRDARPVWIDLRTALHDMASCERSDSGGRPDIEPHMTT